MTGFVRIKAEMPDKEGLSSNPWDLYYQNFVVAYGAGRFSSHGHASRAN
ncbi:4048_t:CDS:2 [Ambispora leptoticha]|uniref:4048_t:CDS:1 n=1 Tax=Ambispora leptoticha TaxID=144679 RepID=A0A9N9AZ95_9GLOM|nr:4048_t:CDS:2 [Ambispora leptoticha]